MYYSLTDQKRKKERNSERGVQKTKIRTSSLKIKVRMDNYTYELKFYI